MIIWCCLSLLREKDFCKKKNLMWINFFVKLKVHFMKALFSLLFILQKTLLIGCILFLFDECSVKGKKEKKLIGCIFFYLILGIFREREKERKKELLIMYIAAFFFCFHITLFVKFSVKVRKDREKRIIWSAAFFFLIPC